MYYLVYGFLKFLSLIPLRILYLLSSGIAFLLYYVFKYRKNIVFNNLRIAFPQKTEQEITTIAKKFYRNFTDNFIEVLKLFSKGPAFTNKRVSFDISPIINELNKGKKVQIHAGHMFNWEYINHAMKPLHPQPFIAVYMPLANKNLDKIFFDLRSKYGTLMLSAHKVKTDYKDMNTEPHTLVLVADQNPGHPRSAFWTPFFGRLTPFVKGPERGSISKDASVIYTHITKPKRGYYHVVFKLVTDNPKHFKEGEITKNFIAHMEANINEQPEIYLWSHRRWKYAYNDSYSDLLV
jgi:Kdo2-lipid IVA lauroyltransferase/acyltransferase